MSVCPPFVAGATDGGAADPDGNIRASMSTAILGAGAATAIVGGAFTVPAGTTHVEASVPLTGLNYSGTAGVFLGSAEAEASLSLVMFRGSNIHPVAEEKITLCHPAAHFIEVPPGILGEINIIPSVSVSFLFPFRHGVIPIGPRHDEQWSVGVLLEAWATAVGGGGAAVNAFCQVPCIDVTTG